MKHIFLLAIVAIFISCNQKDNKSEPSATDTSKAVVQLPATDSTIENSSITASRDRILMGLSTGILIALKEHNFSKLTSFIHPAWGLRFSPYGYVDTTDSQLLSAAKLVDYVNSNKVVTWGQYDGKEEKINLSIQKYFDKFVYDVDFLNSKQKSVNSFLAGGNSLNNLKEVFPESDFTEFYFPGFDPKYGGMDWRTLRLVFTTKNNTTFLIAIVHDEWTI